MQPMKVGPSKSPCGGFKPPPKRSRCALVSLQVSFDLLERAIGYARGALARVLTRQTPCSEWDLLALLEHMDDSLLALPEATGTSLGPAATASLCRRVWPVGWSGSGRCW